MRPVPPHRSGSRYSPFRKRTERDGRAHAAVRGARRPGATRQPALLQRDRARSPALPRPLRPRERCATGGFPGRSGASGSPCLWSGCHTSRVGQVSVSYPGGVKRPRYPPSSGAVGPGQLSGSCDRAGAGRPGERLDHPHGVHRAVRSSRFRTSGPQDRSEWARCR